jgi:hypothetical protein
MVSLDNGQRLGDMPMRGREAVRAVRVQIANIPMQLASVMAKTVIRALHCCARPLILRTAVRPAATPSQLRKALANAIAHRIQDTAVE